MIPTGCRYLDKENRRICRVMSIGDRRNYRGQRNGTVCIKRRNTVLINSTNVQLGPLTNQSFMYNTKFTCSEPSSTCPHDLASLLCYVGTNNPGLLPDSLYCTSLKVCFHPPLHCLYSIWIGNCILTWSRYRMCQPYEA